MGLNPTWGSSLFLGKETISDGVAALAPYKKFACTCTHAHVHYMYSTCTVHVYAHAGKQWGLVQVGGYCKQVKYTVCRRCVFQLVDLCLSLGKHTTHQYPGYTGYWHSYRTGTVHVYNVQCRVPLCSDGHSQTSIVVATSIHNTCVHVRVHTCTADSPEPSFSCAILRFLCTQRSYIHTCTQERGGGGRGRAWGQGQPWPSTCTCT